MEFDFSPENIKRIKKQYAEARRELSYKQAHVDDMPRLRSVGYRTFDGMEAEANARLAVAQAAFDAIKAERDAYRARGFCR